MNHPDNDILDIDFDNGVILSAEVMQTKYDSAMSSLCDRLHFLAAPCLRYNDSIVVEKDEHLNSGDLTTHEEAEFDRHEPSIKALILFFRLNFLHWVQSLALVPICSRMIRIT